MELDASAHPYFVAVQYHPEYLSRPMKPSQPYLGLILAATGKITHFLAQVNCGRLKTFFFSGFFFLQFSFHNLQIANSRETLLKNRVAG